MYAKNSEWEKECEQRKRVVGAVWTMATLCLFATATSIVLPFLHRYAISFRISYLKVTNYASRNFFHLLGYL